MFKEPKEIILKELKEDMWRVFYQIESINNEIEIIKKKNPTKQKFWFLLKSKIIEVKTFTEGFIVDLN